MDSPLEPESRRLQQVLACSRLQAVLLLLLRSHLGWELQASSPAVQRSSFGAVQCNELNTSYKSSRGPAALCI